jgi:uncharacterized protein YbaR (Trm112 family)
VTSQPIQSIEPSLLEILACPACRSPLRSDEPARELVCTSATCGLAYPVRDGIPVLLVDEARHPEPLTSEPLTSESLTSESHTDDAP